MYVPELLPSELPTYVAMASSGHSILAFGHIDDFASALVWCGHAMQQYSQVEQVAIGRPTYVDWPGIGKMFVIMPFEGWVRTLDGWHHATERELQRFFLEVPAEPRSLWPGAATPPATLQSRPSRGVEASSEPSPQTGARAVLRDAPRSLAEVGLESRITAARSRP
jgi:hypothetical protein